MPYVGSRKARIRVKGGQTGEAKNHRGLAKKTTKKSKKKRRGRVKEGKTRGSYLRTKEF